MANAGGFGVTFNIGDGAVASTPTYTAIAQVKSFNGVEIESVLSDITAHDSPGGYDEHIPSGRFNTSAIELELVFDIAQATHANSSGGLVHAMLNKTLLAYQIIFPDTSTTTWTFDAYINKIKMESEQEAHFKAMVTMKPTGVPVLT